MNKLQELLRDVLLAASALMLGAVGLSLQGCVAIRRVAIAAAPTGSVVANRGVARHCVGAAQEGAQVDQRRQVDVEFGAIILDGEIGPLLTEAQKDSIRRGRELRRRLCPPLPVFSGSVDLNPPAAPPAEPVAPTP